MMKFAFLHEFRPQDKPGPGTYGWFVEQNFPERRNKTKRVRIGQFQIARPTGGRPHL